MNTKPKLAYNKSSIAFILSHKKSCNVIQYFKENGIQWQIDNYKCFEPNNLEALEIFHTGKSFDWIEKITGPSKEWGALGDKEMFYSAKKEILKGNYVIYIEVYRPLEIRDLTFAKLLDKIKFDKSVFVISQQHRNQFKTYEIIPLSVKGDINYED